MAASEAGMEPARRFAGLLLCVGGALAVLVSLDLITYVDTRPSRIAVFNDPHSWQVFSVGTAMTSFGVALLLPATMPLVARVNNFVLAISALAILAGFVLAKCC